ncbi:MAG: hypothetical protein EOP06_04405, partial [Proteobacteria bacterium]
MGNTLVILRPKDEVKAYAATVVEKFKAMQGIDLVVRPVKNLNEAADQIEAGQVAIVFADEVLQTTEVNLIAACFVKCKSKPYIISLEQNFIPLTSVISKDLVGHSSVGLTESFMFNSIRNLLTPAGRKLDIRYIRGIVVSVVEVIRANTQCTLSPKAITEI